MGITNHNAVIATTWNEDIASGLRRWICDLNPNEGVLFLEGPVATNAYRTFVMVPDGSKEGWDESNSMNDLRDRFIRRLDADKYGNEFDSPWDWVEVGFGEYGQKVLRGNCRNCFSDKEYEERLT